MDRRTIAARRDRLEAQEQPGPDEDYDRPADAWVGALLAGRDPGPAPRRDGGGDPGDARRRLRHRAAVDLDGEVLSTSPDGVPARRCPAWVPAAVLADLTGFAGAVADDLGDVARLEACRGGASDE